MPKKSRSKLGRKSSAAQHMAIVRSQKTSTYSQTNDNEKPDEESQAVQENVSNFYSNWDRILRTENQNPPKSPSKSIVLRPTQETVPRKCDICDDYFFDLARHHNETHNIIGKGIVAQLSNDAFFSPHSQTNSNDNLVHEHGFDLRTGPKTPNGKRLSISPKRYVV